MNYTTYYTDEEIAKYIEERKQKYLDYIAFPNYYHEYSPMIPEYNKRVIMECSNDNKTYTRIYFLHKDFSEYVFLDFCNVHLCFNNSYKLISYDFVSPESYNKLEYKLDKKTLEFLVRYFSVPASEWIQCVGADIRKMNTLVKKGILDYSLGKYWWRTTLGKNNDLQLTDKRIGTYNPEMPEKIEFRYFSMFVDREDFGALESTRKAYITEYQKWLNVNNREFDSMLFYGLWSLAE